jgi:hypothetical protein
MMTRRQKTKLKRSGLGWYVDTFFSQARVPHIVYRRCEGAGKVLDYTIGVIFNRCVSYHAPNAMQMIPGRSVSTA